MLKDILSAEDSTNTFTEQCLQLFCDSWLIMFVFFSNTRHIELPFCWQISILFLLDFPVTANVTIMWLLQRNPYYYPVYSLWIWYLTRGSNLVALSSKIMVTATPWGRGSEGPSSLPFYSSAHFRPTHLPTTTTSGQFESPIDCRLILDIN